MSDYPTLIVDGDPADWLPSHVDYKRNQVYATNDTVRIEGDLPTVKWLDLSDPNTVSGGRRPLDVGDRVRLATECDCTTDYALSKNRRSHPFATATVTKILTPEYKARHGLSDVLVPGYHVTVTDVQPLQSQ